jgi:predicted secreted acid phosphatase
MQIISDSGFIISKNASLNYVLERIESLKKVDKHKLSFNIDHSLSFRINSLHDRITVIMTNGDWINRIHFKEFTKEEQDAIIDKIISTEGAPNSILVNVFENGNSVYGVLSNGKSRMNVSLGQSDQADEREDLVNYYSITWLGHTWDAIRPTYEFLKS